MQEFKLTQFSHGAGCGCKISPNVLSAILQSNKQSFPCGNLLVGNESRDDAAAFDLGDGTALVSTTDFFMPIVDDPFTFGKIAATNAISDVYAMGGVPLLAIAILGWPVNTIPPQVAREVLEGGRAKCSEAGIPLAGGHSIDSPEPIFGLAVTGRVEITKLKRNDTATEGCKLYLTKPLGVGILTTALKQRKLRDEHLQIAPETMCILNTIGIEMAEIDGVKAMTDVTGFGLLGHLTEMCEGSNVSAIIEFDRIPTLHGIEEYIAQKCMPGGTFRNWDSYGCGIKLASDDFKPILCDPQTSGGLLIAVDSSASRRVESILERHGIEPKPLGYTIGRSEFLIEVR